MESWSWRMKLPRRTMTWRARRHFKATAEEEVLWSRRIRESMTTAAEARGPSPAERMAARWWSDGGKSASWVVARRMVSRSAAVVWLRDSSAALPIDALSFTFPIISPKIPIFFFHTKLQ
uniref:Uncharacterized protein n=1 Tax=Opuntia streptacantha TaxID=393608 RepID=A0A7C8Z234_OPUST